MKSKLLAAFTFPELLIVITVLTIIAFFLFPPVSRPSSRAPRINCVNNLKHVGLAFHTWANDNKNLFPMQVSTNLGGTLELINGPNAFAHFEVFSNELSTPKILFCPAYSARESVANFADLNNMHLSYFVGVDAVATNDAAFLSGDRNITNGLPLQNGIMTLTTNAPTGWTSDLHNLQGNVGLADGSVQQVTRSRLRFLVGSMGMATNRLALP